MKVKTNTKAGSALWAAKFRANDSQTRVGSNERQNSKEGATQ